MTWSKLTQWIAVGRGQGHQAAYQAWLQVTKKTSSPVSAIGRLPGPDIGRPHHCLAMGERTTILLLKWLGASDIREQFPAWPCPHPHPIEGIRHRNLVGKLPGLLSIAKDLGIDHGVFPGTSIPYVATLDILSTWPDGDGFFKLHATECKPQDLYEDKKSNERIRERLALSGEYCRVAEIPRQIFHPEQLPKPLGVNLDALFPPMSRAKVEVARRSRVYQRLVEALHSGYTNRSPHETVMRVAKAEGMHVDTVFKLVHLAIWTQDVDHDISLPLELFHPLIPGGRVLREALKRSMTLGGDRG
ncbi:hypothetical protein [Variovorax sp. HJSM1_2]|uniref:hypothetical protein n=1 Tax=Variovorax sp. HJSM1_2 TaxID=3366263 RepID=UPI003BD84BB0